MCAAYIHIQVPDLLWGDLLISQCFCDFLRPLSAVLATQALSGHILLPRALSPLIPLFCFILYSEISLHTSVPLVSAASCAPPSDCLLHQEASPVSPPCSARVACVYARVCGALWPCWPSALAYLKSQMDTLPESYPHLIQQFRMCTSVLSPPSLTHCFLAPQLFSSTAAPMDAQWSLLP